MTGCEIHSIPGFSDPVSSISHLLAVPVAVVLGWSLLRRGRGFTQVAFLGVYVFSCVFLFSMSGVYHLLPRGSDGRLVLERLDHAAIFVLIAGTFTAAHGILFTGLARWLPLFLVWAAVAAGITLKTIFFSDIAEWVGLSFYLGLGWIGIFSTIVIWRRHGTAFIKPLVAGGVAYTAGAMLEFLSCPSLIPGIVGPHELFHMFVLVGAGLHYRFLCRVVEQKEAETGLRAGAAALPAYVSDRQPSSGPQVSEREPAER